MPHTYDWVESVRQYIIPKLGLVTQLIEDITGDFYYVESEMHNTQFVGRVPLSEDEFEEELHEMGFVRNPLSSLKTNASTGETEEGSWRKVGFNDNPEYQLHVVIYDGNPIDNADVDVTYVYAHWELAWDKHPVKHYRGVKKSGPEGARRMKKHLDESGLEYEPIRP